VKSFGMALRC